MTNNLEILMSMRKSVLFLLITLVGLSYADDPYLFQSVNAGSPEYDEKGRIESIKAPAGNDGAPVTVARFVYKKNETEIYDALGRKKVYRFAGGRLNAIETFADDKLYLKDSYVWENNLLKEQAVGDHRISYKYDKKGRLIEETLHGNLSGLGNEESFSKWFVYSSEKSLLLKEGDDSGAVTRYIYEPSTDWLLAKFTCEGTQIRLRTFYKYDEAGHLIEVALDNGSSELEKDLNGVSERKLIKYKLVDDPASAAFGKPLVVDQCYLNLATGKEQLFSRVVNHYNEQGMLEVESAANSAFDENGNLIEKNEGGTKSRLRYDLMNRLIGQEKWGADGEYVSETYRYDAAGNKTAVIDTFGNTTLYEYDELGRPCKVTLPQLKNGQPVLNFEYDVMGRCTCFTNAKGEKTFKSYNCRSQPTSITYPDGTKELFEYNLDGTLEKSIDAKGVVSSYEYDYLKRKISTRVTTPSGAFDHETRFQYNAFHLLSTSGLSMQYNDVGMQTALSQANGAELEILYDQNGHIIGTKEWYGDQSDEYRKTYALRDEGTQIKEIRMEDAAGKVYKQLSSSKEAEVCHKRYRYDYFNDEGQNVLALQTTDGKGFTTVVTFDPLMREDSVVKLDPYGEQLQKTTYYYDLAGNMAREVHAVSTPDGSSYSFANHYEWGSNHKLLTLTEAAGSARQQKTSYFYNDCGQLISMVKPDSAQLFYEYDELGRIKHFYSSDSTVDYTISHDAEGRITEIFDAVQNTVSSKQYDGGGRLVEETLGNGLTICNEYDRMGRRTKATLPDQSSIVYEYDAAFLRAVHRYSADLEKLYTHEYTEYDKNGYLLSEKLPAACGTVAYRRDELERCIELNSPYWKQTIQGYDLSGNMLQMEIEDPLGCDETNFSFDATHQITAELGEKERHYKYDSIQNRCAKDSDPYRIDTLNQLLSTDDADYSYDGNGNITRKKGQHHEYGYQYDALNRLVKVVTDELFIEYTYDLFNRRLSKRVNGELTSYLYDGDYEIGAVDNEGALFELRVLGVGLGGDIGAACAIELEGTAYAPLHDQMGSVRGLVEMKSKKMLEFYRFSAFGEEEIFDENSQLTTSLNPWRYLCKRIDAETGLVFFGKRYYEPSIGRFTTKDPMQFLDGPNRYAFAHNNPLANRDIDGLYSVCEVWDTVYSSIVKGYDQLYSLSNQAFLEIKKRVDYLNLMREHVDIHSQNMVGKMIFILTGYQAGEAEQGVYGNGEINDKIRVTWINGILNIHPLFMQTVKTFSETHGGTNIHYVFRPTDGWGRDLINAVISILGYTSADAKRLAHTWKDLLKEMGPDGMILHYAHSIGGTESYAALHLISTEERRRIRMITFGSATIIPNYGLDSSINYLSRCDFMGYVHLIESYIFTDYHIEYVGSYFGYPLIDHLLHMDTYAQVIEQVGLRFVDHYGSQIGKR